MAKKSSNQRTNRNPIPEEIRPLNASQDVYMRSIERNHVVFGLGAAGTGKTFLAAAAAVKLLNQNKVGRIVVCRPIVEACDEDIGFLPGYIRDKCDPYIRPIYDGFEVFWGSQGLSQKLKMGLVEICPLAYMRGRTFDNTFVIADEMQNANRDQILMLLTRLGQNSKIVITGDPDQRDRKVDGLEFSEEKLSGVPMIDFVKFDNRDVVRHDTVIDILDAWES